MVSSPSQPFLIPCPSWKWTRTRRGKEEQGREEKTSLGSFRWTRGWVSGQEGHGWGYTWFQVPYFTCSKYPLFLRWWSVTRLYWYECRGEQQSWWLGDFHSRELGPQKVESLALRMGCGVMRLRQHAMMSAAVAPARERGCCFWQRQLGTRSCGLRTSVSARCCWLIHLQCWSESEE